MLGLVVHWCQLFQYKHIETMGRLGTFLSRSVTSFDIISILCHDLCEHVSSKTVVIYNSNIPYMHVYMQG